MQRIVSLLVFQRRELPTGLHRVSPWPDARFILPTAEMLGVVEGLRHRRFLTRAAPTASSSGGPTTGGATS
jgi:hypothetical protein